MYYMYTLSRYIMDYVTYIQVYMDPTNANMYAGHVNQVNMDPANAYIGYGHELVYLYRQV